MYTRHRNPTGTEEEHERNVVEHMHDKLFRLLPYYIRTKPGKTIGAKLQREMLKYIEDKIEWTILTINLSAQLSIRKYL